MIKLFSKNKKDEFKIGDKIKYKAAQETSEFNLNVLEKYFKEREKIRFNPNNESFAKFLDKKMQMYRDYGYEDDIAEIFKKNKNIYHYWESMYGINKIMQETLMNLYLVIKRDETVELPDINDIIGSTMSSDYDTINLMIDLLLEESRKSSKKRTPSSSSMIEYAEIMRHEVEKLVNKYFHIYKADRTKCNAFNTMPIYYCYHKFIVPAAKDNKHAWDLVVGLLMDVYK